MRKAIYELLANEKAKGNSYEEKIRYLKNIYSNIEPTLLIFFMISNK